MGKLLHGPSIGKFDPCSGGGNTAKRFPSAVSFEKNYVRPVPSLNEIQVGDSSHQECHFGMHAAQNVSDCNL